MTDESAQVNAIRNPCPNWKITTPGIEARFELDKVPNAFHRFMQKIILGITWERIEK